MSEELHQSHIVALLTLGCAKNEADSRAMRTRLTDGGYTVCDDPTEAEYIVLNTCAFIEPAVEESVDTIVELAELERMRTGKTKLLVAGCLPSRFGSELASELPEVSAFIPVSREDDIVAILNTIAHGGSEAADTEAPVSAGSLEPSVTYEDEILQIVDTSGSEGAWAYVKISDGCSRMCSYCTIPLIRGPYVSYSYEHIRSEVSTLVSSGAREIILIGQDTGIWREPQERPSLIGDGQEHDNTTSGTVLLSESSNNGGSVVDALYPENENALRQHTQKKIPEDLPDLLEALASEFTDTWFRVMYLQPEGISDKLLAVMASHANIARYLDIPLQHANEKILKAMNRRGSGADYLLLLQRIRAAMPDITLRTTVMTGFPGESKKDFNELKDFLEEAQFDYVGIFAYSREQGTSAAELPGQIKNKTALKRVQALRDLTDSIGFEKAEAHVDEVLELLVCGSDEDGVFGRTKGQAPEVDGICYIQVPEVSDARNGHMLEAEAGSFLQAPEAAEEDKTESSEKHDTKKPQADRPQPGTLVRVKITESFLYDLYAEVL